MSLDFYNPTDCPVECIEDLVALGNGEVGYIRKISSEEVNERFPLQGNRMSFIPELSGTENPRPKPPSVVLA